MSFSITSGAAAGMSDLLAAIGIGLLVLLLFFRELASMLNERARTVARALAVAILPMLITFGLLVVARGIDSL